MWFTPGMVPMLPSRILQLTLLTSLVFGTVSTVFSAPLIAEAQQDLPATIPSLSSYDGETRRSMELACISEKGKGPVAYGTRLNRQIASLQGTPGIPSLSGHDGETRRSMELACISEKGNGPVAYALCLNRQIASLQGTPGVPNLSGFDGETRRSMELACISEKGNGPVPYASCLNRQIASLQGTPGIPNPSGHDGETRQTAPPIATTGEARPNTETSRALALHSVDPMSGFTSENVLKVH